MEMHFIQIPKFKKEKRGVRTKLEQWMQFISQTNERGIELAMKENKEIKKAKEEYEYLTGDAAERRLAFLRDKAIRDEKSIRQGGIEEGRKEGIEKGKKEGRQEKQKEIAKELLKLGMKISDIQQATKLTKEEIQKLKEQYPSLVTIHILRSSYDNDLTEKEKSHITEQNLINYHSFDEEILNDSLENLQQHALKIVTERSEKG